MEVEKWATKSEVNGLGVRLNALEQEHSSTKTKVESTEKSLDKLEQTVTRVFDRMDETYEKFSAKADGISKSVIIGALLLIIGVFVKELIFRGGS